MIAFVLWTFFCQLKAVVWETSTAVASIRSRIEGEQTSVDGQRRASLATFILSDAADWTPRGINITVVRHISAISQPLPGHCQWLCWWCKPWGWCEDWWCFWDRFFFFVLVYFSRCVTTSSVRNVWSPLWRVGWWEDARQPNISIWVILLVFFNLLIVQLVLLPWTSSYFSVVFGCVCLCVFVVIFLCFIVFLRCFCITCYVLLTLQWH